MDPSVTHSKCSMAPAAAAAGVKVTDIELAAYDC
jgi:hypothetical protein